MGSFSDIGGRNLYALNKGSVLGPTLFLIYVNSMTNLQLHGKLKLYADDTMIFYSDMTVMDIRRDIQADLMLIEDWMRQHKLTANVDKSSVLWMGRGAKGNDEGDMRLEGGVLRAVEKVKFLGLEIDRALTWKEQVAKITKKIAAPIGVLKRLSYCVPKRFLRSLYFSLIHSHIQYLNIIWGSACKNVLRPLEILQNKAIKNLYALDRMYPTLLLYRNFNIPSVSDIYYLQNVVFIHQIINNTKHSNINVNFRENIHQHYTRNRNNIDLPNIRTRLGESSIYFHGMRLYNNLPFEFKSMGLNCFKNTVKNYRRMIR